MIERIQNSVKSLTAKGERFLGTDIGYLVRGGSWLTISQGINTFLGLLLLVIFTNFLPKETYGTYRYILSFVGVLSVFSLQGVSTAIIQSVSRGFEGSVSAAVRSKLRYGLLISITGLGIATYYFVRDNNALALSFLFLALLLPFQNAFYLYRAVLNGKKLFKETALYEVLTHLASLIILGLTVYYTDNIAIIILVYFVHYVVLRGFIYLYVRKKLRLNNEEDSETLSYGKHLSLMRALSVIIEQADKILVFHYLGAAQLAIYALAVTPIDQLRSFINNLRPLALPKFSNTSLEDIKNTLPKKIMKAEIILIPITVVYILLAPTFFTYAFSSYSEAVLYSQVLALLLLFTPRTLYAVALTAHKRTRELYIIRIVGPLVRLVLLVALVLAWGLWGAVAAVLIHQLVLYILYFSLFKSLK